MGLLKDTYNITKIDNTGVEQEIKRMNDIQEKQNEIINNTKDRVDISLKEYEELKNEIKAKSELLKTYDDFINNLAYILRTDPKVLLKGDIKRSEIIEDIPTCSYRLFLEFSFEKNIYDSICGGDVNE